MYDPTGINEMPQIGTVLSQLYCFGLGMERKE
jgi:hypothetical protein